VRQAGHDVIIAAVRGRGSHLVGELLARGGTSLNSKDTVINVWSDVWCVRLEYRSAIVLALTQDGETALMHAVRQHRAGVVAHLVELGADINVTNNVRDSTIP